MARKNDLEVTPAQEAEAGQHVRARVESPSKTIDKDRADTGENGKVLRRPEDEDVRQKGTIDAGSRHDELDSDDAEDLAGLINDASLSGANIPGTKPADKISEGTLRRTYYYMTKLFAGSSQKPTDSSSGNSNLTSPSSTSQNRGKPPQVLPQEIPDNSAVWNGDKATPGKSLARPNVIYENISKMQRPRRFGRPDPYDVPQSPPRSPAPEPKPNNPKRRGPKPKRVVVTPEKLGQVAMAVEEAPISAEEELAERQKHVEHADRALGRATRAILASEERTARPKRATRSTRTNDLDDLEGFQQQRERYQRKTMKESRESRELLQFPSPTRSWLAINKGQLGDRDAGNQAGTPATEPVESQNDLQVLSRTNPQSKIIGPAVGRRDIQLTENIQVTPAKLHDEVQKGLAQDNAQLGLQGISPILSGPTPANGIQESPRRLQRPSQWPSLVPKATQGRKQRAPSQQVGKEHPVRSPASARIPQGAQDDTSDEDNIQHESDVSREPTPKATAPRSNEDGPISFIEEETLSHLKETIKKAGLNSKDKRVIRDGDYWTAIAGTLTGGVMRLISKYKAMNDLISASVVDVGKVDKEHQKALKCIEIIREETQAVLTNRLGDPEVGERNADKTSRSHMLEDLYLYVIPNLVEALYCAVKSRQDRETLEISDMEEFYALLKILYDLVKASRAEDKSVQPKAPRTNSYSISQPTLRLWPTLRKLYKQCGSRLAARKVARRAEQLRQTAPERSRKRKERLDAEERAEEEQFQQRLRERNKAIIASLNERRAELGLPPCSQPIDSLSTSQHPQTPKYKEEDPFDDVDYDMNGRLIGVFGRNNSHPGTTPKEWTKVEMEILVDGLRQERGTYTFYGEVKQSWS
jgi:hypothetical protein